VKPKLEDLASSFKAFGLRHHPSLFIAIDSSQGGEYRSIMNHGFSQSSVNDMVNQ
jgi:hypothetical protein